MEHAGTGRSLLRRREFAGNSSIRGTEFKVVGKGGIEGSEALTADAGGCCVCSRKESGAGTEIGAGSNSCSGVRCKNAVCSLFTCSSPMLTVIPCAKNQ
jgi:hypothetical protein